MVPKPPSFELLLDYTALFYKIIDNRLLMAIKPTGQRDHQEVEVLYDMGYCTNRLSVILPDNNIIRFIGIFAPYEIALCTLTGC
jgi:hypothetical protein